MLLLEDRLGHEVAGLAYPFGYSNAGVRRAARDVGHRYACAVSNATARLSSDLFAVPRLTIKRSTTSRAFDRVIFGERVPLVYLRERTLTKGWAVVRRGKAGIGKARQANRFAVRAGCDRASEQGTAP